MHARSLIAATFISLAGFASWAQTGTPAVDQRQENQAQRIDQGQASGQLTPREARRLERQQARIGKAEAAAKADGDVKPRERLRLHRMQNEASKDIRRQKHDRQRRGMPPSGPGTGAQTSPGG